MNKNTIHALLKVTLLSGTVALTGCPDTGGEEGGSSDTTADTVADTIDIDSTTTRGSTSTDEGPEDTASSSSSESGSSTTDPPDPIVFPDEPYDAYVQIDRHGAVEAGTAGILASQGLGFNPGSDIALRDEYNASNPVEDEAAVWVDEIVESVTFFHDNLDDDLEMGLGLTVATVNQALMQAGPVIVPDTIKYDPANPTLYPNGRNLQDPSVDITLAAVLLDLGTHGLDTFAMVPLNPPANDVEFASEFPYLAAPHVP